MEIHRDILFTDGKIRGLGWGCKCNKTTVRHVVGTWGSLYYFLYFEICLKFSVTKLKQIVQGKPE